MENTKKSSARLRIVLVIIVLILLWLLKSGNLWSSISSIIPGKGNDSASALNAGPKVKICTNNGGTRNSERAICDFSADKEENSAPKGGAPIKPADDSANNEPQPVLNASGEVVVEVNNK